MPACYRPEPSAVLAWAGVGLSRRHLDRALTASLRRLGVETIDLYQLHT